MRFGDYEVLPGNQWCYQIYRLLEPETAEGKKRAAKYRKTEDGKLLEPIECYPNTLSCAIERIIAFSEMDGVKTGKLEEVYARLEALREDVKAASTRCRA